MTLHPLIRAAQQGSLPDIDYLLDQGTDVDVRHESSGRTALAIAAHSGHSDACQLLLRHGAGLEVIDHEEKTPLHLAVEHEHLQVVHLLLQQGAKTQVCVRCSYISFFSQGYQMADTYSYHHQHINAVSTI